MPRKAKDPATTTAQPTFNASAGPTPPKELPFGFFQAMADSIIRSRMELASRAGISYGGRRNLNETLGYKPVLLFEDFFDAYKRGGLGRACIKRPIEDSWAQPPEVSDQAGTETVFDRSWNEMVKRLGLWNRFERLDTLSSIGRYAVMVLGFNDSAELVDPLEVARAGSSAATRKILYATPFAESNATIEKYEENAKDPRFGLPLIYAIQRTTGVTGSSHVVRVHHSRVIHVAEDELCEDGIGTPALECVYDRLQDLDKTLGGAAEMFWQSAGRKLGFKMDQGSRFANDADKESFQSEIDEFAHKLKNYFVIEGATPYPIEGQTADPSPVTSAIISVIAAQLGIPVRILLGSERGELASSQDERAWRGRIANRQAQHCTTKIVRPFVDLCLSAGALPFVAEYEVTWAPMEDLSEGEVAAQAERVAKAIKEYQTSGADAWMPPRAFLRYVLKLSEETIEEIENMVGAELLDEVKEQGTDEERAAATGGAARGTGFADPNGPDGEPAVEGTGTRAA